MALRRYCDECGDEILGDRYLQVGIDPSPQRESAQEMVVLDCCSVRCLNNYVVIHHAELTERMAGS